MRTLDNTEIEVISGAGLPQVVVKIYQAASAALNAYSVYEVGSMVGGYMKQQFDDAYAQLGTGGSDGYTQPDGESLPT